MQSKFRFSFDGVDATARQFAEVRRQLRELSASVGKSVSRVAERVSTVENDFKQLTTDRSQADAVESNAVDELKATVESLSLKIAKIEETYIKKSTMGE